MPPQAGFYFDPMYFVFIIPALLLTMYAQNRVRSAYARWSQVWNRRNVTGVDVAQVLLPNEQMSDVRVEMVDRELGDHYDPQNNILRLSPGIAQQPSIAAMSVAAHEIGHAEQDRDGYFWMKIRSGIVPLVGLGSSLGYLVFMAGLLGQIPSLAWIGIILVSGGMLFSLVTLPVEFDASNRALRMLKENNFFANAEEEQAARDMLSSAALTYVAGAAQAVASILYYVFLLLGSSSRRRNY